MLNVPPKNTIRYRFVDALSSQKLAAPSKSNGRARRVTTDPNSIAPGSVVAMLLPRRVPPLL